MLDVLIPTLTALSDGVVAPDSCGGVVANGVDNCGGVVAKGVSLNGVHDSCGGIVAPDLFHGGPEHGVSLADWHKTDDPWGAFLETHDVPQGNTVYIPYGEGGPDVVAAAHDGGTTMSLNGVHDGGVTAPAPAPTTVLGAGPEVYNNFSASQNCVGGSETSCIPEHPPVGDPSKTGLDVPLPAPASWYATTTDHATMVPAKEIAIVGQPALAAKGGACTAHASPGHLVMACHAFALAGIQGLVKGDFATFKQDAADNAAAATPVGGYVVTKIIA